MNYRNIYYSIINKAKEEDKNGNRLVGYFEKHHILPKSLGGSNDKENLIKLTAREHFICHWLLVKMYDKGSAERNKMLCAFWKMQQNPKGNKRYINSRAYAKLKLEYSTVMRINQIGNKNSQYGKIWYTNRNTGESKTFKEIPIEKFWIKGRNLFNGESDAIYTLTELKNMEKAKLLWNEFHSGSFTSIRDFCRKKQNMTQPNLVFLFKKYIPIAKEILIGRSHNNKSNIELVNKFYR